MDEMNAGIEAAAAKTQVRRGLDEQEPDRRQEMKHGTD